MIVTFAIQILGICGAAAQSNPYKLLWKEVNTSFLASNSKGLVVESTNVEESGKSNQYREFVLNVGLLQELIAHVTAKSHSYDVQSTFRPTAENSTQITVPAPDGSQRLFAIEDAQVLPQTLATSFPRIKVLRGESIDEGPKARLRAEVGPSGFHAQVRTEKAIFYVEPIKRNAEYLKLSTRYASFSRTVAKNNNKDYECFTVAKDLKGANARSGQVPDIKWGDTINTYRTAIAATAEYTKAVGGSKESALEAISRTINRVNEIYEQDLSIHLELIQNEADIIFTDARANPLHNDVAKILIGESQEVIDRLIGDPNYDIGHTFSTGAGGLAQVGGVMQSKLKAQGVTGRGDPTGDPFSVDYVAHEMGHQFGANHTFNGIGRACQSNRYAPTAYERGSGSTILGYAGICGSDDLQNHTDTYFHTISVYEITQFVAAAGAAKMHHPSANHIPSARIGASKSIPARTPFALGAIGEDLDAWDVLTYSWEELDLGPQGALTLMDDGNIPLFRSTVPASSGVRRFGIIGDGSPAGEILPSKDRNSLFRVTVRDNRYGGGALSTSTILLKIVSTAGPFRVTSPDGLPVKPGNYTVKWDVANTTAPPIQTRKVTIRLSKDGGSTFPDVLAQGVDNNGQANINLPASNLPIVLRVEGDDNYFFADSKATPVR